MGCPWSVEEGRGKRTGSFVEEKSGDSNSATSRVKASENSWRARYRKNCDVLFLQQLQHEVKRFRIKWRT
jgi:hypothetical protein